MIRPRPRPHLRPPIPVGSRTQVVPLAAASKLGWRWQQSVCGHAYRILGPGVVGTTILDARGCISRVDVAMSDDASISQRSNGDAYRWSDDSWAYTSMDARIPVAVERAKTAAFTWVLDQHKIILRERLQNIERVQVHDMTPEMALFLTTETARMEH